MKNLFTVLVFAICLNTFAQDKVSLSVYQDAKLGVIGDKVHGYDAGTLDLLFRFKMQGYQKEFGYLIVFPEFEYAEIKGLYKRYSVNVGYTLNKLVIDNTEVNASLGWGWIDRYGKTVFSWGASSEIAYKVSDKFKIVALGQLTERKDLKLFYGKNEIRFSGFIGIEFNLN